MEHTCNLHKKQTMVRIKSFIKNATVIFYSQNHSMLQNILIVIGSYGLLLMRIEMDRSGI